MIQIPLFLLLHQVSTATGAPRQNEPQQGQFPVHWRAALAGDTHVGIIGDLTLIS